MTDVYSATVEVTVPVYPTEVEEKVRDCLLNLFPDADTQTVEKDGVAPREIRATTHSVEGLRQAVEEKYINDAVNSALSETVKGRKIEFDLSKQAACVGRLNIEVGGHELGSLHVEITSKTPYDIIDYIAPVEDEEDGGHETTE
ncbi:MAG: RNA-binding domain-containing protein [Halobacteria archaeon]|nr:RNA-binding domain-containing protein [Halobacteria archaeon]